ncbi:hypothetical protein [Flagellimonas myxillae]|uniref:hypothetical protein n=1 Tax=Flagellimonas myxillae TaxID=2942214 RepID=UPI00201F71D6|nr:hypothetical protein [Muricauda myxillae]MCL6265441.1 hypothetical protein [Muricauda myxillae]
MLTQKQLLVALLYFVLAAFIGLLLRLFVIFPLEVPYKFLVHTHSHIALLGWVYVALTTLIYSIFLRGTLHVKKYKRIFWFTQFTLVGMLVTFPLQGYALFSIIFSTLFLVASYWFFGFFLRRSQPALKGTPAYLCIRAALWYMVISSLGPWALGMIMNTLGPTSMWYRMAIYFYLHFQYNGWMMMALLGLFLVVMDQRGFQMSKQSFKAIFWSANAGIVLSFFLSVLWIKPPVLFHIVGGLGALFQIGALVLLLRWILRQSKNGYALGPNALFLGILIILKFGLQLISSHPYFAQLAASQLDFTIGYLHLTFLGVVTLGIFMLCEAMGYLKVSKAAFLVYTMGFLLTEVLIFYRGIAAWLDFSVVPNHSMLLALASGVIVLGLILLFVDNVKQLSSG